MEGGIENEGESMPKTRKSHPVIRQNCVRGHVITLQRVHNGDEDRRAAGLR
jgi:hypothetical protein